MLLFNYEQGLSRAHYLQPLNRVVEYERYKINGEDSVEDGESGHFALPPTPPESVEIKDAFRLTSGRVIRSIDNAPPKDKRMWITPVQAEKLQSLLQVGWRFFKFASI